MDSDDQAVLDGAIYQALGIPFTFVTDGVSMRAVPSES